MKNFDAYFDGSVTLIIGLIVVIFTIIAFLAWLFWTFSGMLMDYTGTAKYGWVFQLVITLIMFGLVGSSGKIS